MDLLAGVSSAGAGGTTVARAIDAPQQRKLNRVRVDSSNHK
jgi:hypothetical protein